ncbi:hypothetical protein CDAR_536581 [Caerostris darwini]|uniref:Uncharacterized protein n=1 Tax=Caerostris darwini TaxID=1538125 RepID=A0AAV4V1E7_9ARAC|nr:hypothetical protein CDAR_536581 [Caerostris darwini]
MAKIEQLCPGIFLNLTSNLPWYFLSNKAYHSEIYHAHRSQAIKERREGKSPRSRIKPGQPINFRYNRSLDRWDEAPALFVRWGANPPPRKPPPRGCRGKDWGAKKRQLSRIKTLNQIPLG